MIFTTPCFVRVENVEERKGLLQWLEMIGYISVDNGPGEWNIPLRECPYITADNMTIASKECGVCCYHYSKYSKRYAIDCGDDVELFKALAAMNDENESNQWFTNGEDWYFSISVVFDRIIPIIQALGKGVPYRRATSIHKATVSELIEHFKHQ